MLTRATALVWASLSVAAAMSACAADPPTTARACRTSGDCTRGETCLDGRCQPRSDGGDGSLDSGAPRDGGDPSPTDAPGADATCAAIEETGGIIRRPIDAIVLPDESGSMADARDSVAAAMDGTFRTTMEAEGIDYHVVWNGTFPLPMLEASGRLTRNPLLLGSGDDVMFRPVLDSYDTWRPALRDDALKVFVHFTDAQSGDGGSITGYTGTFDEVLVAREPALWGTPGAYKFVYHAFVGLTPNDPIDAPYEPAAPVVGATCDGRFNVATPLQEMARRTSGLRFPLCLFDRFDAVFRRIAESAIERALVPCELELPVPPAGRTLDPATIAVRWRPSTGAPVVLLRVASLAECTDSGFVLEGTRVTLCPAACARVTADPMSALGVLSGCSPELY